MPLKIATLKPPFPPVIRARVVSYALEVYKFFLGKSGPINFRAASLNCKLKVLALFLIFEND